MKWWYLQWYANAPSLGNVNLNVAFCVRSVESNAAESDVTV